MGVQPTDPKLRPCYRHFQQYFSYIMAIKQITVELLQ
jgi:hypothetical protein